ncbi:MAG: ferrochelatase [Candidatus Solibacter usitatus]|nr:ferrochelatase [Candidatus Solibacter usitatus]
MKSFDAILLVGFGGPEGPDDVMPFLENVTRGRGVPPERLREVAEHYLHFGGRSPINDQNRALIAALEKELAQHGPKLPVYWGNRNWHPFLADAMRRMKTDGVGRALAFVTSAFSSYSSCRQYKENVEQARAEAGDGAPEIEKLRVFWDHPAYLEVVRQGTWDALQSLPSAERDSALILFTAHSIPKVMADTCRYASQLTSAANTVANLLGGRAHRLVYQSRSGPPSVPWLGPDVLDAIKESHAAGHRSIVLSPIGFVSDHLEVLYDLDTEAQSLCAELGIGMARAATAGTHPYFVRMIRELIVEHVDGRGVLCAPECCPPPARR